MPQPRNLGCADHHKRCHTLLRHGLNAGMKGVSSRTRPITDILMKSEGLHLVIGHKMSGQPEEETAKMLRNLVKTPCMGMVAMFGISKRKCLLWYFGIWYTSHCMQKMIGMLMVPKYHVE